MNKAHCINLIRRALMCYGEVTTSTHNWVDGWIEVSTLTLHKWQCRVEGILLTSVVTLLALGGLEDPTSMSKLRCDTRLGEEEQCTLDCEVCPS